MLPKPLQHCIALFSRFPSMGPRQATRFSFYLRSLSRETLREIGAVIVALSDLKTCPECFMAYDTETMLCPMCSDPHRSTKRTIMVVERETDVMSLEKSGVFRGRYCVIGESRKGGVVSPEQRERINALRDRIQKNHQGKIDEIIIAFNHTAFSNANADFVCAELKEYAHRITRLGRGIPTGGEIEFADEETLTGALDNRK